MNVVFVEKRRERLNVVWIRVGERCKDMDEGFLEFGGVVFLCWDG